MNIVVKSLIGIFTIIDGKIYLLGDKLINITCTDIVEKENTKYINKYFNIDNLDLKQCYTFSEKKDNELVISILYMDIINYSNIKDKNVLYMPITDLDSDIYVNKIIDSLRKYMVLNSTIKKLYPNEFVLPEIQKIYEDLLGKKFDRRNFRKKLIKLDIIEDLDKMSDNKKGRPAKLYKFKEIIEDKSLF